MHFLVYFIILIFFYIFIPHLLPPTSHFEHIFFFVLHVLPLAVQNLISIFVLLMMIITASATQKIIFKKATIRQTVY